MLQHERKQSFHWGMPLQGHLLIFADTQTGKPAPPDECAALIVLKEMVGLWGSCILQDF